MFVGEAPPRQVPSSVQKAVGKEEVIIDDEDLSDDFYSLSDESEVRMFVLVRYRKWGKFYWAKFLRYPLYMNFHGNTFAV